MPIILIVAYVHAANISINQYVARPMSEFTFATMDTITTSTGAITIVFGWCVADSDFDFCIDGA